MKESALDTSLELRFWTNLSVACMCRVQPYI